MKPRQRERVVVIGDVDSTAFDHCGLMLVPFCPIGIKNEYHVARALVISEPPGRIGRFGGYLDAVVPAAEIHGLRVYVISQTPEEQLRCADIQQAATEARGYGFVVQRRLQTEIAAIAREIAYSYCSPILSLPTEIQSPDCQLSENQQILLRRAFHDCDQIHVERLDGGTVAKGVFRVHASLAHGQPQRPLAFFVKFLKSEDYDQEWSNYHRSVEAFVPFNLRPNLIRKRCAKGHPLSVLVGSLVDEAIPLRDALRLGAAAGALFALFETSLKGMRLQSFARPGSTGNLSSFVEERAWAGGFEDPRAKPVVDAARTLGLKDSPARLIERLSQIAKSFPYCFGPTHGDLHAGNVMVRRGDAIVVDFGSIREAPLTYDPAVLEASLVFGTDVRDSKSFSDWKKFADLLYEFGASRLTPPIPEELPSDFSWLNTAVRELRHVLLGCNSNPDESAIVLATCLIRFARLPIEVEKPKTLVRLATKKHAYALVVAEKIVKAIEWSEGALTFKTHEKASKIG